MANSWKEGGLTDSELLVAPRCHRQTRPNVGMRYHTDPLELVSFTFIAYTAVLVPVLSSSESPPSIVPAHSPANFTCHKY